MYAICITRLYRLIINLLSLRFISHNGFFTLVTLSIWCFSFVWFHKKKHILRLVEGDTEEAGSMEDMAKDDEVPVVPHHRVT